ncbi:2-dehydropantoate 2-reductase [Anaerolineales bacterium]|nr:2-dehydropantoate 2-reductase [Anaerolineales bacterium]
MKIMVMGSGGVGAYYGGLLAKQGNDVIFVARGAHLQVLREKGLQVKSIHGDFDIVPAKAVENPADAGIVDLILFCVKTYNTDDAAKAIQPVVGPQTVVVSLQNGIDAAERLGKYVSVEHILGGVTYISSAIEAPGVVKQMSQFRRIVVGELGGGVSPRVEKIVEMFRPTGITIEATEDIQKILWTKYVFISSASGLGSLTRLPMGEYRAVPETRAMILGLMKEVESVAQALGIALDPDVVEKSIKFMDDAAPHIKASMQLDVEMGRKTELEAMISAIGHKGREAGVPTPIADFIYAALLPIELKARAS